MCLRRTACCLATVSITMKAPLWKLTGLARAREESMAKVAKERTAKATKVRMQKGTKAKAKGSSGMHRIGGIMAKAAKARMRKVAKAKEKAVEKVSLTLMCVATVAVVGIGRMSVGFLRRAESSRWPMMVMHSRRRQ